MAQHIVNSAEWNPDGVIVYVSEKSQDGNASVSGTKKRECFDDVSESDATCEKIKEMLASRGYNVVNNFNID